MGAAALIPPAWAQPDPHVPNGAANWCPGGKRSESGGATYWLGAPFADGTFYADTWALGTAGPFGPGAWFGRADCYQLINNFIQPAIPNTGACGGGPESILL